MLARTEHGKSERLEQVLASSLRRFPPSAAAIEAFARAYFRQVDPEDLAERAAADLYGTALSHWNFARRREPGKPRVRVFNPSVQEHGWQSTHTIIEIVNDDMPFLVDSVTMEVNRHGLTLHLIIHPIIRVNRTDGTLIGVLPDDSPAGRRESFIHVEVDRVTDPARMEALAADLERVLDDVRAAVEDWQKMLGEGARDRRRPRPPPAAGRPDGARRGARVPRVARRQPLHLPRLSRPRPRDEGRRRCARSRARLGAGRPAREAGRGARDELRAAAAAGARLCAREGPARSSPRRTRARRCTAPATSTTSASSATTTAARWRASTASSASTPTRPTTSARARSRSCAARSPTSRRGRVSRPAVTRGRRSRTSSTTIRATSSSRRRGRALRHRARDPAPRRSPALPALRPPRPLRAIRRLPHLRAARELQHRSAQSGRRS